MLSHGGVICPRIAVFFRICVLSAFHLRILRSTCVPSAFHLRSICVPSAFHICPIGPMGPSPLGPWALAHGPMPMGPCPLGPGPARAHGPLPIGPMGPGPLGGGGQNENHKIMFVGNRVKRQENTSKSVNMKTVEIEIRKSG